MPLGRHVFIRVSAASEWCLTTTTWSGVVAELYIRLSFSGAFESKASPDLYDFVPRGWGRGFRPTGGPTPGACVQRDGAWHGAARSRRYGRNHAR